MDSVSSRNNPWYFRSPFSPYHTAARRAAIAAISSALDRSKSNITVAAASLGLQRTHLHRLMKELGISRFELLDDRGPIARGGSYRSQVQQGTKEALIDALAHTGGNRAAAARQLGIGRLYMNTLMKRFGLRAMFPPTYGGPRGPRKR